MQHFTEADLIANFDHKGNNPRYWRMRAKELLAASSELMELYDGAIEYDPPDPIEALDYHGPALMLRAMAFECLLKARALDRNVVLARDGRYIKIRDVADHDLLGLAKKIDFDVNNQEEVVLRRLSFWVMAGRYPIQRQWSDQMRLRGGRVEFQSAWLPQWDDVCTGLLARLE